ncbi:bifunctional DNA primase/polymerase [Streptomyces sp. SL13]|uniref:Bifunctional DNA primase/polymerase n=1 Tax=Streptantibioticus silvisoli TaxID=2705255 RepID=A0AA90GUK4_9ACTN|nr:bifunctional DNA primase/polymerase [Streptantibioticus silvisoli]MDI5961633.1 bifunctional DNA primase/polymerase [Streptantibioticus silvisoli]MDI5968214.1 bifunctional DNA primase/polymerase [Streptantibioticus silvisoli]
MERGNKVSRWLRRRPGAAGADTPAGSAERDRLLLAAVAAAFRVAPAARPSGYGCSCDRVGCPTPGMHPVSFAWQTEASADPERVTRWLRADPRSNFISATGTGHDVLDVPAEAGRLALARLDARGTATGPVARYGEDRTLFFTASRGTPDDEDEWWPCELDCHPETLEEHPGLRWHCRGSYVLLPPSRLPDGTAVDWLRPPLLPLPDPLTLLDVLTDACARVAVPEADGAV